MTPTRSSARDLTRYWQRHDWRENFLAPGLVILQALTTDGRTASGAGLTRQEALDRCLGETAEIAALAGLRASGGRFDPWRDGLAAHPDPDQARQSALDEAYERRAVSGWWLGLRRAVPLAAEWLDKSGLSGQLATLRAGAALRRRTDWWRIPLPDGPAVMICRSMSLEGQYPILGYGTHADPVRAAGKALRELLLMEMNLMELLAARSLGMAPALQAVRDRIRDFARRGPQLFPQTSEDVAGSLPGFVTIPPCRQIGEAQAGLSVWLCQPDIASPRFDAMIGQPYF